MADANQTEKTITVTGLDTTTIVRQLILFVGMAASVAIGVWVVLWSQEPNYTVLFGSLAEQEASVVLDALQQLNIPHKVDESTGAVLVSSKLVRDARIKLAAQGLPKGTAGGFGGNDKENGFFVSDSKEKAQNKRFLEMELSRTIVTLANIKTARVHLAIPARKLFVRDKNQASAAVVVTLYAGRNLDDGQVAAIAHMVSSSVPNLSIDNVSIVDQKGHLLTNGASTREMAMTSTQFDYARRLEKSYIERIESILAPILGADSVSAQVTADIDFTFSEQQQEAFNPDTPTTRSIDILEESSSGLAAGGVPGALSNQPPGAAAVPEKVDKQADSSSSTGNRNRKRELKNFELDKTVSVTRFAMGRLRRLSAAVVVDDLLSNDKSGEIIRVERSPEDIERITELVKKAMGFNLQRGDSVNVINAAFTVPVAPEALPVPPIWEQPWVWDVAKQAMGGIFLLIILLFVLKPAIKILSKTVEPVWKLPAVVGNFQNGGQNGDVADDQLSIGGSPMKQLEANMTPYDRNLLTAKQTVETDPKLVAQVVKNWVTDSE